MAVFDPITGEPIFPGSTGTGLRNVGSYQVSGEPWITGSNDHAASKMKRYKFPFVTRELSIINDAPAADHNFFLVHFASGSGHDWSLSGSGPVPTLNPHTLSDIFSGRHFVTLSGSQSVTFRAKIKEIYISTTGDIANSEVAPQGVDAVANYTIIADMTNVPTKRMYHLTGSGHTEAKQS